MTSPSVKRISSGIKSFDAITAEGIPENTATMVYGPPKAGKSIFAYHFLAESIREGEACIIVTTDYGAEELTRSMSGFNWSIQEVLKLGSIQVITMIPVTSSTPEGAGVKSVSLANPTELMLSLGEILTTVLVHLVVPDHQSTSVTWPVSRSLSFLQRESQACPRKVLILR